MKGILILGTYKKDQICKDFDTVMGGINTTITDTMKKLAIKILESVPDNQGRDFAISNLLYSAEFIKSSILREAKRLTEQAGARDCSDKAPRNP